MGGIGGRKKTSGGESRAPSLSGSEQEGVFCASLLGEKSGLRFCSFPGLGEKVPFFESGNT